MELSLPPYKCSKCGSVGNTETFSRRNRRGVRCLSCGHEKVTVDNGYSEYQVEDYEAKQERQHFRMF